MSDFRERFRQRVLAETGKTPEQLASQTPAGVTRKLAYDAEDLLGRRSGEFQGRQHAQAIAPSDRLLSLTRC